MRKIMSSSGKSAFGLRGPKKRFMYGMKTFESSSLNSFSSDSPSDNSSLATASPGSFTQALSPISPSDRESSRMPVSDVASEQSPNVGVDSLTSPSMIQKLDFSNASPRDNVHRHYDLDDHWLSVRKQHDSRPSEGLQTSPAFSASSHDSVFSTTKSECSPASPFDINMFPSPSELCMTPDTISDHILTHYAINSSYDAQVQSAQSKKNSLSLKRDLSAPRYYQEHVSPDRRSTISTSPNSQNEGAMSPGTVMCPSVSSGNGNTAKLAQNSEEAHFCQVCEDTAAGFHCGAYVCEACKKFFVRCLKQDASKNYACSRNQSCAVTKETRTQCQFCRFQKCVSLGMYKPGTWPGGELNTEISNIPCKVCGAASSGYHFGAITCEGCKGFFRRTVKERDGIKYSCNTSGSCKITTATRNSCKYCRYQKCLHVGMTPSGSRIGRQPNAIKHQTMLELQQLHSGGGTPPNKDFVIKEEPIWSGEECQLTKDPSMDRPPQHSSNVAAAWNKPHPSPPRKSPQSKPQHCSAQLSIPESRLSNMSNSGQHDLSNMSNSGQHDCSNEVTSRRGSGQKIEPSAGSYGSNLRHLPHLPCYDDAERRERFPEDVSFPNLHSRGASVDNIQGPLPVVTTSSAFSRNISHSETTPCLRYHTDIQKTRERSLSIGTERSLTMDQQYRTFHHMSRASVPHISDSEYPERTISHIPAHPSTLHHDRRRLSYPGDDVYRDCISFDMSLSTGGCSERIGPEALPLMSRSQRETSSFGNERPVQTHEPPQQHDAPMPIGQKVEKHELNKARHSPEVQPPGAKKTKKISTAELIENVLEASQQLEPIVTPAKQKNEYLRLEMSKNEIWDTMMMQFAHSAYATVKFAKKVPGFRDMPMQQQIGRVQSAMYQIVLVMLSTKYNLETGDYYYFCFSHEEEALIIKNYPQFKPLPQHFKSMGKSIATLQPDKVELALLCALCLFMGDATDSPSDDSPERTIGIHLLGALADHCEEKSGSNRYGQVLSLLTFLQKANSEHLNCVIQVKMSMPDLQIPELYEETFLSI